MVTVTRTNYTGTYTIVEIIKKFAYRMRIRTVSGADGMDTTPVILMSYLPDPDRI